MFWLRIKKIIFSYARLSGGLVSCKCLFSCAACHILHIICSATGLFFRNLIIVYEVSAYEFILLYRTHQIIFPNIVGEKPIVKLSIN